MAFLELKNVTVKGIAACVPKNLELNEDIYSRWGNYEEFFRTTGIEKRHKAPVDICTSDLCIAAAENLIKELHWDKSEIDTVVFVSQTPDYILPATSCIIQNRLGLSERCYTLDISLGCSGWVYALSVISALMQNGNLKKGLLLAGDTALKYCSPEDKSTYPLFGDAGSATALEYDNETSPMYYNMNTDGSGFEAIIIRDGGSRNGITKDSLINQSYGEGVIRSRLDTELDGMSVFSFGISKAPQVVNDLLAHFELNQEAVDCFTFHQANLFMNEKIRKKLKLPVEKVPYSLKDFGNTSSASIPLTLLTQLSNRLKSEKLKHIACGFGVGLSWGAVSFETNRIVCPNLILL